MHTTTVVRSRWAVAALVGAALTAGCGTGPADSRPAAAPTSAVASSAPAVASSAPAPSAAAPSVPEAGGFGRVAAQADLDAAVVAAGLTGPAVAGLPERSTDAPATERERARREVADRMAACAVAWSSADGPAGGGSAAEGRTRFDAVLVGLAARGWAQDRPVEQESVGGSGSMTMATYKKQGWTLLARHHDLRGLRPTVFAATEDTCTSRFSDEELALLED
ncbi:hypothetical protein [Kitasatospora camelliae]|uniref:Lipoprotein n=1 Tax=Kitasatospora camelliae TaxID=3156397 RepID=A0AAU8JTY4_9ACTN